MVGKRLNNGVAIVGAGMSKFGVFPERNSRDLFVDAFKELRKSVDKGFDPNDIGALYVGNAIGEFCERQSHISAIIPDAIGLAPKPTTRCEGACASASLAMREGILAIASGLYDMVLVGGTEKMNNLPTEGVTEALASAMDVEYEVQAGFTFPGIFAAMGTAYMDKYGATVEHFMKVGIKNHENGALNPKAHFGSSISQIMEKRAAKAAQRGQPVPHWEDEMDFLHDPKANPVIAWPMRLFDCSPITDGASCLLLVREELAKNFTDTPIYVIGTGQGSDYPLHNRDNVTSLGSAKIAAQEAYRIAGVGPQDIRIAEVHDCFTIGEIIATEDLGFFPPGEGAKSAEEGRTARDGDKPINTSGGLKSKGHPVGATGTAQVAEVWHQMRGEAGKRQVQGDIPLALTHNAGGSGCTCLVHIFERR